MPRCSSRAAGYATPRRCPSRPNVEPHTLIRLLQDGMSFDQLQAEACNVRRPPSQALP